MAVLEDQDPDTLKESSDIPHASMAELKAARAPGVELRLEPGSTRQWEEFRESVEPNTAAIDGYVEGPIQRDLERSIVSFNHHEGVDRSSTLATCQQALFEMRHGLYGFMTVDGEFKLTILANDCDEDVCTAVFILRHPEFCAKLDNPALNRLVDMEGLMDVTGGFHPWPKYFPSLAEFFWVYEPYHTFRNSGGLGRMDPDEYKAVIDEVGERIEKHITGRGGKIELDTRYKVLQTDGIWSMVEETGKHAKVGMLADGILAFTSVSELPNGRYKYSVGRLSPYIPFDILGLYNHLNELEGLIGEDKWGGGDTIGGSPRSAGSGISPEQMAKEVANFIKQS